VKSCLFWALVVPASILAIAVAYFVYDEVTHVPEELQKYVASVDGICIEEFECSIDFIGLSLKGEIFDLRSFILCDSTGIIGVVDNDKLETIVNRVSAESKYDSLPRQSMPVWRACPIERDDSIACDHYLSLVSDETSSCVNLFRSAISDSQSLYSIDLKSRIRTFCVYSPRVRRMILMRERI